MNRLAAVLLGLASLLTTAPTQAAQIWLAGHAPGGKAAGVADYADMFQPNAPWSHAASLVQVFKTSTNFVLHASDQDLAAMIRSLQAHHIQLAIEGLMLSGGNRCGKGVEGYTGPRAMAKLAARIRQFGGTLSYVAMDEPVFYGHIKEGPTTCNDSLSDIANQIAPKVNDLRAAFPAIVIGDIEPLNDRIPGLLPDILEFARLFRTANGIPLQFEVADIDWDSNWELQLPQWRRALHGAGMQLGVVFNGNPRDFSDQEWAANAVMRYRRAMSNPATQPDQVIFQSWMTLPSRMLPEDDFGTMTSIVVKAVPAR